MEELIEMKKKAESLFSKLQNIDGEIPEMKRDLLKTFLMFINLGPMTAHDILVNKFPKLSDVSVCIYFSTIFAFLQFFI